MSHNIGTIQEDQELTTSTDSGWDIFLKFRVTSNFSISQL